MSYPEKQKQACQNTMTSQIVQHDFPKHCCFLSSLCAVPQLKDIAVWLKVTTVQCYKLGHDCLYLTVVILSSKENKRYAPKQAISITTI